jgi:hypothetical protein
MKWHSIYGSCNYKYSVIEGYAYFNAIAFYPIVSTFGASLECFGGLAF